MVLKNIPTVDIGTGLTLVYSITPGRTAIIKQLTFTNTSASPLTVSVYDGSGITSILKVTIPATSTLVPAEVINRRCTKDMITAVADGVGASVDGYLEEE
ncbi:MAG: hypothetical protein QXK24_07755 [Ignisphaera sp.]